MSNKYVLDPSGKIIINGNLKDANEASEKILKNQNDFFYLVMAAHKFEY